MPPTDLSGIPKPGSDMAIEQGCICPVMDNAHGLGIGCNGAEHGWWMTVGCPLHQPRSPQEPEDPRVD